MAWRMGRRYAAVFPDPVFALASTSFKSSMSGIAFSWTGVGFWNLRLARAWSNRGSRSKDSKEGSMCFSALLIWTSPFEVVIGSSFSSSFLFMVGDGGCEYFYRKAKLRGWLTGFYGVGLNKHSGRTKKKVRGGSKSRISISDDGLGPYTYLSINKCICGW